MEQRANDLLLAGIDRQIQEAAPTIARALGQGFDVELRLDTFGHLNVIRINKHKLQIKPFQGVSERL